MLLRRLRRLLRLRRRLLFLRRGHRVGRALGRRRRILIALLITLRRRGLLARRMLRARRRRGLHARRRFLIGLRRRLLIALRRRLLIGLRRRLLIDARLEYLAAVIAFDISQFRLLVAVGRDPAADPSVKKSLFLRDSTRRNLAPRRPSA